MRLCAGPPLRCLLLFRQRLGLLRGDDRRRNDRSRLNNEGAECLWFSFVLEIELGHRLRLGLVGLITEIGDLGQRQGLGVGNGPFITDGHVSMHSGQQEKSNDAGDGYDRPLSMACVFEHAFRLRQLPRSELFEKKRLRIDLLTALRIGSAVRAKSRCCINGSMAGDADGTTHFH